jgi:hypothetical protein
VDIHTEGLELTTVTTHVTPSSVGSSSGKQIGELVAQFFGYPDV